MQTHILLSSQLQDDYLGKIVAIRGRIFHKEISNDNKLFYLYIRDDNGLITCIFESDFFPELSKLPIETFILVNGVLSDKKQPFITRYIVNASTYELLSPPSDNIEPLRAVLSSIRFLYIRRLEIKTLLIIKRFIRKYAIQFLENHEFQPVETPVITSFTQINRQALRVTTNRKNEISEREKFLIQKSQFYLEAFAHAFGKVYTLTPAFRADHRESELSLAEFWLLEVEEIFSTMNEKMDLLESLIQFICSKLIQNHKKEIKDLIIYRELSKLDSRTLVIHELPLEFWNKIELLEKNQLEFLNIILQNKKFPRVKYRDILQDFKKNGEFFQISHLREKRGAVLTKKLNSPVFVTEFPFELRHFYDKKCLDDPTYTLTFDLIGHGSYGEIASGSEREYRVEVIEEQMHEKKLRKDNNQTLQWYYKLQGFGSVPHAGFSIGLERLTSWLTQTENITDTVGFPRRLKGNDINY